jgi:hypothetical protein
MTTTFMSEQCKTGWEFSSKEPSSISVARAKKKFRVFISNTPDNQNQLFHAKVIVL